jgi:hypothetical protein
VTIRADGSVFDASELDFTLSYKDIVARGGVYQPKGRTDAVLVVVTSSSENTAVLYVTKSFIQAANPRWRDFMFRRLTGTVNLHIES